MSKGKRPKRKRSAKPKTPPTTGPNPTEADELRSDDDIWTEFLEESFHDMLRSVLPELAKAVDTSRRITSRNKELQVLGRFGVLNPEEKKEAPDASDEKKKKKKRSRKSVVDILVDIPLLSGGSTWLLLHVEIQGKGAKRSLPLRMHRYRCLLEARYDRPVAGLAILFQPIPEDQAEGAYRWEAFGSRVLYEYPVFKLYEGDEETLRRSRNPFDLAHYAGLLAWKKRKDDVSKLTYMKILLAEMKERDWEDRTKMSLLWLLEGIMRVKNPKVWKSWEEELERRKEEGEVYISLMERKGRAQGEAQTKRETALRMLEWGNSDENIIACARITPEELACLKEEVFQEAR